MSKNIAIMQPYFFPYIGYWQLINAVDEFIIYDNIEFVKKGWIHRNRILLNNKDTMLTLPLKKDSDYLCIKDRFLADSWERDKKKILNKIKEAYQKTPFFNDVFLLINEILDNQEKNLFKFIYNSILMINEYLKLKTEIIISSSINIDHSLKSQAKVISICKNREANQYINAIGGTHLYDVESFKNNDIKLNFIKTKDFSYQQLNNNFIPNLSIIDLMMFNSQKEIKNILEHYTLL